MKPNDDIPEPLQINHRVEIPSVFADHFVIRHSHDNGNFHLLFFESNQPIQLQGENSQKPVTQIDAQCVARIVVPGELLPDILRAMAHNYLKSTQEKESADDQQGGKHAG